MLDLTKLDKLIKYDSSALYDILNSFKQTIEELKKRIEILEENK